jgi:hypothetical protein
MKRKKKTSAWPKVSRPYRERIAQEELSSPRHSERCTICKSPARAEIEEKFCNWVPQSQIARESKLGGRLMVYRHAVACGLFEKRDKNLKASLAHFIERGFRAKVTGASFVAAVVAYSKIDDRGRTVERMTTESDDGPRAAFGRMTRGELRTYAETGTLPDWFPNSVSSRT